MSELKLKMSEVVEANAALQALGSVKMSISLNTSLCNLEDSLKNNVAIYQKQIKKLMDENCEKDENGFVPVDPSDQNKGLKLANKSAYWAGITELDNTEVPIMYDPIDLGTLEIEHDIFKILKKFMKVDIKN